MSFTKTNTHKNVRKSDLNILERKLLELQEKYNLADEAIEKLVTL